MGPALVNDLPARPRFSWDTRNAPWTDGVGDQEPYANAVRRWSAYHDTLPDSNGNKVLKASRGMILHSQLYGRAKIRGDALEDSLLCSEGGIDAIVDAVYKMDPLSVCNGAYSDYVKLLSIRRSSTETYANYEGRFSDALTKLNSSSAFVSIHVRLAAWSLIHNANIDPSQHLGVMSAAVSSVGSSKLTRSSGKDAFLSAIRYETFAAVVRQCDNNASATTAPTKIVSSMSTRAFDPRKSDRSRKKKLFPSKFADLKAKSRCKSCEMFGHWATEHDPDGSLSPTVKSTPNHVANEAKDSTACGKKVFKV